MQIKRLQIPRRALAKLPANKRDFFLLSGHMQNEINVLHKTFAYCLHRDPDMKRTKIDSLAGGAQALVFARTLAGKLLEGWEAVRQGWFSAKVSLEMGAQLHPDAVESLSELKAYFSGRNSIFSVRNNFGFHYSVGEFDKHWEHATIGGPFEVVLGGTIGNNLNLGSELTANAAVMAMLNPDDWELGQRGFLDDVQSMAHHMITFFEGVSMAMLEEMLGPEWGQFGIDDEVFPTRTFREVGIPFFTIPDAIDAELQAPQA